MSSELSEDPDLGFLAPLLAAGLSPVGEAGPAFCPHAASVCQLGSLHTFTLPK